MGFTKWAVFFFLLDIGVQSPVANADMILKVFSATSKSIVFQWDKVTGATSYVISVANANSPDQTISYTTFGANTVMGSFNSGLTPNTNYFCKIEAKNAAGLVLSNGHVTHTTAPDRMDPLVSLSPKDSTTLVLEFITETGASKYIIRVQDSHSYFREFNVTGSPAEITSLQPYTEYKVSALAANDGGQSQPTAPLTSKTLLPRPQLQSSSSNESTIDLSWGTVDHAVLYTMCLTKHGTSEKISQNSSSTSMTFSGLDAGALYLIEGYAWDAEGRKGEHSNTNQTTRPPTPESVTVSIININNQPGLSVSWIIHSNLYGVVEYHVTSDQGQKCNTSSSSCDLQPVSCGEVHSIQVVAQNDAGPSVPSSPVVFTTIPCPPKNLVLSENSSGSCSFSWDSVPHADSYRAFIRNGVDNDVICNSTNTSCDFFCYCGYTYLTSVFAINKAGLSQEEPFLNYTTLPCCPNVVNVSLVSTDSLEIVWLPARGAETYETLAADNSETVHCNDTAPVCMLSYLTCDTSYSVVVTPCNDISGCNRNCSAQTKDTAACTPTNLNLTSVISTPLYSTVTVSWTTSNRFANYTVTAKGDNDPQSCSSWKNTCNLTNLLCGNTYEFSISATSEAGESLPSYTELWETQPCCPSSLSVEQVTQAMTNVSWPTAKGAHTFLTSLTSSKGHARCHTEDSHCLMGCITCGTSYTVTMEAYSVTGLRSNCSYNGFSSSICCPSGVRLYRAGSKSLRVNWRLSLGSTYNTTVDLTGVNHNYTCTAIAGQNYCDVNNVQCGDVYSVVVAPVTADGTKVKFCAHRKYSVNCAGESSVGTVLFRGRRSVE